ncbi:MAG TPA: PHP domain-containing protein [Ktedonobacteraceae bacterium]|jgi:histidinol-phosphatase (PHP family)|nr:PHP domain-containing protein [Ktedonobacteraceae bacterium]
MTINTDMHSHVSRSSALQMAMAAQQKGLYVLGLSEHVFQMQETRLALHHLEPEGPLLTFSKYTEDVLAAATQSNVDIRLGLEVDFIPGKNELIHSFIQEYNWDFLIGSVHEINGIQIEASYKWSREEGETLWLQYFELLRRAVRSGYFSVISHPVRLRVNNPYLPPTFDEELEHLAAEATRYDIALEINGFDMLRYHSLVHQLAKACLLHHTPVSVGSDAHVPRGIAQAHQQTENMLHELGITKIRLWKQMKAEEYFI